jgi:indole-3-glycerol phosphate synthase
MLPPRAPGVAESGIRTAADLERLCAAGYDGFLVGEALMREADPGAALTALLSPVAEIRA